MSEGTPDDLWTPYKHLSSTVGFYLGSQSVENNISKLDISLRKHKQNFLNLLRNPPKNAKSREEIKRGITDGIIISGQQTILSKDLVDESLIISDMYNMNEDIALALLTTAQQQMSHHPGLPRGLVAVLLYYDGRKTLVSTLRDLFQARQGLSWCTDKPQEVTNLITNYTDSLVDNGILIKILECLESLDVTKEIEILSTNRALGPPKHHRQVIDLFEEIRLLLATTLFNWSAQCGLPKDITLKLIDYLSKYKPETQRGGIDNVTLALQMALFNAFDISVVQKREDGEELVKRLPFFCETGYAQAVSNAFREGANWECEGLWAVSLFSFGLSLATLRSLPQNLHMNAARIIDLDESFVEASIQKKVFNFIYNVLLDNDLVFTVEFYYRRIHSILTDFIELMHSKVTELRASADETGRVVDCCTQQGIDPPGNLCRNFEMLLLSVGKLYENDKLELCLGLEYWESMEMSHQKATSRSVSLFKFIRLAGELLPTILFVPYLKMLSGLASSQQSARNAFNLLKQGSGVSGSSTLSWDHFFNSLTRYYVNLRQEQNPRTETVYGNRAVNRNISPQEIEGLQAVLGVIRSVASEDEVARITLCGHPSWSPLNVLLGLVTCSCIIPLKADLLQTLAALSKSKETAIQLWNILEASQIITTIQTTNNMSTRGGIESELEQIESRNETYPLTQAVLDLLYNLVSTVVPKNLGAGPRKPGLDPYLTFIVDSVFLRFYNRIYKDPAEKWVVAEKCLKLLDMFVRNYEPNPADFPMNHIREENPPPGFHVMLQLNTKSDVFRLLLQIVDEACTMLDTYNNFPGKTNLETCALYSLNIIEKCLAQQDLFFDAHFAANCSVLMSGINKLLLGVNPRSGKPDHMLNITKFVTYNTWLSKHTLISIRILSYIARQPNVNQQLLGLFTQNEKIKNEIRHGFVECLESEGGIGSDKFDDSTDDEIEVTIKKAILNLLEDCLPQSAPNLSHYLLGFDITKDIRATHFQQPGVMNFPRTCTKALIVLLDSGLTKMKANMIQEKYIENAYSLLYALCQNSKTSEVILRFLRECNDFLSRHISALPFKDSNDSSVLNQMTGLLKSVAIELKTTAANNQISQFGNLSKILLGVTQNVVSNEKNSSINITLNMTSIIDPSINNKFNDYSARLLICRLLDCLDFEIKPLEKPKWDYFDNSLMHELLQSCEVNTGSGPKVIDLKKLHEVLKDELSTVQSTMAAGQRQLITKEIESVLMYALDVNAQKNACISSIKFLEAWGQVTEILFCVASQYIMTVEEKQTLILEILQALLNKVAAAQIMSELANLSSSTVLLLLVYLRHCYIQNRTAKIGNLSTNQSFPLASMTNTQITLNPQTPKSNSLSLKYILKNIVEWIIVSGVASQKLRINLYAALLNYMHIIKGSDKKRELEFDDKFLSRLDKSTIRVSNSAGESENIDQSEIAVEVFSSFGDKLIDILCHDCTGGMEICKMLAFSCVDMLLDIDSMTNFIQFISKRGYLSHLIDSLIKSDVQLCRILENTPENFKALYVYESKMAMLSRIASSYIGAELLLEQKVLGVLSGMKVYDLHPDFQVNTLGNNQYNNTTFIPPVAVRYRQILFPALNLCDVILSTLGPENHSAITQVVHFLLSHGEMIEIILRAGTPFMDLGLLGELSSITGIIARSANQEITGLIDPKTNLDLGAHLYRLQKLMLTLLPRFLITEATLKDMFKPENITYELDEKNKSRHVKLFLEIASNLALYARNSIANYSADHRTICILFSPNISSGTQRDTITTLKSTPSLGLIVSQLKNCVEHHNREKKMFEELSRQRNSLPNLSLDTNVQHQFEDLNIKLRDKREELKLCLFLSEQCLYLLWAHLDYYMLRAVPVNALQRGYNLTGNFVDGITSPEAAGWKITSEDVSLLKTNLISVLNEKFCKQLLLTTQDQSATDKGFTDALIRRIKRLIQFVPVK